MRTTLAVTLCILMTPAANAEQQLRTITVSAQSEIRVTPDEAIIAFSVFTQAKVLLTAKVDNDSLTTEIVKTVRSLAVAAEDFKVTDVDVGPRQEHGVFEGYGVTRSFEIRTADFSKIDPIIGGLVEAGGDTISISRLKLQVRDQRKHQVEARRLAVEYAKEKAAHLAELNQMKLGTAVSITEDVECNGNATGFGGFGMGGGMTGVEHPSQSPVAALPHSPVVRPRPQILMVNEPTKPTLPSVQTKEEQEAAAKVLLSPGQVSVNAVVKIEFELLPK
ncbi:MAG: SIMPL domain-containing protein [Planctomycetota bacterium]|nr:SIMPL domain-containing protein [Planctomycetota bacterium]